MGTLIDATRHVRDSTSEIPDIFFYAGVLVALVFIVVYFRGLQANDPRKGRYKAN
jgi:hypothetical protein